MLITRRVLMQCKTENLARLARALGVRMPSPMLSAYRRHRALVDIIDHALRRGASAVVGAACVVVAFVALGLV